MDAVLDRQGFVQRYGDVYEHSPWVAELAYERLGGATDAARLADVMAACVDAASGLRKLALLRAHPDLAGRVAVGDPRTPQSDVEQARAGLDRCTPDEFARFAALNESYRQKFGFPFIMAVRNSNRHDILAAFERRLGNDRDTEFAQAMQEVHTIARLRLEALQAAMP